MSHPNPLFDPENVHTEDKIDDELEDTEPTIHRMAREANDKMVWEAGEGLSDK